MNTDARERLKRIREGSQLWRQTDYEIADTLNGYTGDIDFLLSLYDSQVVFDGPCVGCGHNNYDAEKNECAQRWMEGRMSVVCGCPCAKHNSLANAATRMREACVEKVQAMRGDWQIEADARRDPDNPHDYKGSYGLASGAVDACDDIITALESLTLEQVEQEQ